MCGRRHRLVDIGMGRSCLQPLRSLVRSLSFTVAPSKPDCGIEGETVIGNNIQLTCRSAEGSPSPQYSWKSYNVLHQQRPLSQPGEGAAGRAMCPPAASGDRLTSKSPFNQALPLSYLGPSLKALVFHTETYAPHSCERQQWLPRSLAQAMVKVT